MELEIGWGKHCLATAYAMQKLTTSRDEILYHAKIHPEQYSNTLSEDQIKHLHSAMHYVCATSVDLLADSEKFPEDWLFKHRWEKGKKNHPAVLPNGEKITFLTVGGRTSAVVPSVQKKTGPVAKEADNEDANDAKGNNKRKRTAPKQESDSEVEEEILKKKPGSKKESKKETPIKEEEDTASGRRRSTRLRK